MKWGTSIQFKAAFLLLVFGLNTIVCFACAMGVDMGFNTFHHHAEGTGTSVPVHANVEKYTYYNEVIEDHRHHDVKKEASNEDNCCNNKVIKILQIDKSVPQSNTTRSRLIFTTFVSLYYKVGLLFASQVTTSVKYFVRSYHPPIPDIRIALQSFQI